MAEAARLNRLEAALRGAAAAPVEVLPSLVLPVAQVGDLIALKLLSRDDERRPQDAADLRALLPPRGGAD